MEVSSSNAIFPKRLSALRCISASTGTKPDSIYMGLGLPQLSI